MSELISTFTNWFDAVIAGSAIWSAIGLGAAVWVGLFILWLVLRSIRGVFSALSTMAASRKRRSQQGYGISVAPISGPSGAAQTKALIKALEEHFALFSFSSPFEIIKAPKLQISNHSGLRTAAAKWLEKSSTDLIVWGRRDAGKKAPVRIDVLSLEGSLSPSEAVHSEEFLPYISSDNAHTTSRISAYLIARALQPGLADATAFRAEKLAPVADILFECLQDKDDLPERTVTTIETDYCAMGLHLGSVQHLTNVINLRRKRLAASTAVPINVELQSRIDLGRALLDISKSNFDPVRVREAMDHLKLAVDRLKEQPALKLANATADAVRQGQAMLSNRKRFSVTGGSPL